MFAIIRTGSKQYQVSEGSIIEVEKLADEKGEDLEKGSSVKFDDVLMVHSEAGSKVGTPLVKGASVTASVLEQKRGKKVIIFKKIRRHGKQLKKGHRQSLTRLKIESISA